MESDSADEKLHPGHRSIRLRGHDYSAAGFYFVTICTENKKCTLGPAADTRGRLSALGEIVRDYWVAIPEHFANVRLHAFVVMPNHFHGIVELVANQGRSSAAPLPVGAPRVAPGSLGTIVRSFKAAVTKWARAELKWEGEVWQRNYFERVLRDGQEIADATAYISENPKRWEWDRENPDARTENSK